MTGEPVVVGAKLMTRRCARSEAQLERARTLLLSALFAMLVAGLYWMKALTLRGTAWRVAAQIAAGVAIQLYVLWRCGLKMPMTGSSLAAGAVAILAVGWAIG
jgi:hypothetical protein